MSTLGLHITKCAGTSLMSSIRRLLTEDEYLLISSFYENILAARADIWDVVDFQRLTFVFGHYIHESLLHRFYLKSIWDIYLFTGVREPTSRAISQYYQLKKITGCDPDIQSFISEYGSSMCDEIIRAFPSLAKSSNPKWLSAAEVLTAFDYIYSTEDYSQTIGPVYESIGLSPPGDQTLNSRDNVRLADLDSDVVDLLHVAMVASDDINLYSLIKPAIGQLNAGKIISDQLSTPRKREELFRPFCNSDRSCITDINYDYYRDMMGYELNLLGHEKKQEVLNILQRRRDQADELIKFISDRIY